MILFLFNNSTIQRLKEVKQIKNGFDKLSMTIRSFQIKLNNASNLNKLMRKNSLQANKYQSSVTMDQQVKTQK